jgi:hypothetical protein
MKHVPVITGAAAMLLLAACASTMQAGSSQSGSSHGTVTGRLLLEGGPIGPGGQQPGQRAITGTIVFTSANHRVTAVPAGGSGTFSASLPAGSYQVAARSPRVAEVSDSSSRQAPCTRYAPVTVTAGHRTTITLTCIVP